jgi:RNA polymerase sigma-70 factor (ECF subfamily)
MFDTSTAIAEFEQQRPDLERIAYRMLGTRADADDVLQEAYLRWSTADHGAIRSARAFLTTVVTRLSIDRRREVDARKETYIGPWLPEPLVEPAMHDAVQASELAESVSLALMHVLETLSPVERAAYLLRKVFDYDYAEIAEILEKSEANCRQLVSRAEQHVQAERPRFDTSRAEAQRMSERFLAACATGELAGMVELLSDDIVIFSDGGGKAKAAGRPLVGTDHAARFLLGVSRKAPINVRARHVLVNGQPGLAQFDGETLITIMAFEMVDNQMRRIYFIRNPDKLARIQLQ